MPKIYPITCYEWFLQALANHNSDTCLEWPFSRWQDGYGKVRITNGPCVRTNRFAFELTYGRPPVPNALHTCDNRICFNPRHLFEGTNGDNNRDRAAKGRSNVGESRPQSKLTEDIVRRIRAEYVPGIVTCVSLASTYGVDPALIMRIIHRTAWKHVK